MVLQTLPPKRIATLALLSALAVIGRLILIGIPNVQPITVILLIITLEIGWFDGVIVAIISIMASNLLLGSMGPWTLSQIASFCIIVTFVRGLKFIYMKLYPYRLSNLIFFSIIAGLTGYLYGFIISLISVWLYHIPHFWVYYAQGLFFDSLHAIGNIGFWWLLAPLLPKLIQKIK